jgi:DNA invertase Pin-like site-specific DNA recombinase
MVDMENVVLLCRCSTNRQDYNRQIAELTDYCNGNGWSIMKTFANKVSGAKKLEEREEIQDMIAFVKENKVDKVVVLEISRLGRNTLEALKLIQLLNEHNIALFVKNYNLCTLNPDGKPNPVASLICTILLEIAQMERLTIAERMESGRNRYIKICKEEGIKMGRPSTYRKSDDKYKEQYAKEISLLRKNISLRNVNKLTGTSVGTLRKLAKFV